MKKILIVKLGAMGDVLRTTPLLSAYRRQFSNCHITWVVEDVCSSVLKNNPLIDELLIYSEETLDKISKEEFDIAINLDKEKEALDSIEVSNAKEKKGFSWNRDKTDLMPIDESSEYAYRLGIDDDLKFKENKKTYQEISYEQVGLPFENDPYIFSFAEEDNSYAEKHLNSIGVDLSKSPLIGINTGSGEKFAGKRLPEDLIIRLSKKLYSHYGTPILLLGGPSETQRNKELQAQSNGSAINTGTNHSIHQFAGIVSKCSLVVTGDTIAMHIAIATDVPSLVYFGSTCHAEIELYGKGRKIISDLDCSPCYKKDCPIDEICMSNLKEEYLMDEIQMMLGKFQKQV